MPLVASAEPGWTGLLSQLPPGDHAAILTGTSATGIVGRLAGLELRDAIIVLLPGPASGFVFLFRKPIKEGTVVAQVLATETGGLNIAGCRVGLAGGTRRSGQAQHLLHDDGTEDRSHHWARTGHTVVEIGEGRWPPNVLFVHAPTCEMHADDEWTCVEGCPVPMLNTLSGPRPSTLTGRADPNGSHEHPADVETDSWFSGGLSKGSRVYADEGGASRFYPQFKDFDGLLGWLSELVGCHPSG